jgi:hypothetical protein
VATTNHLTRPICVENLKRGYTNILGLIKGNNFFNACLKHVIRQFWRRLQHDFPVTTKPAQRWPPSDSRCLVSSCPLKVSQLSV